MNDTHSFCFDGYEMADDRCRLFFRYSMTIFGQQRSFTEEIKLPQPIPQDIPASILSSLMQGLHLILGISYWKLTCPKNITINHYSLSKDQASFWNTVYTKGLGEFFYRNKLDFQGLVNFPYENNIQATAAPLRVSDKSLVGIAGGKDSLLTTRLMKEHAMPITGIVFETSRSYPLIEEVLPLIAIPVLKIRRVIDPQLYELNRQVVYNGHIPISAVYAFLGFTAACFYGFSHIIVSNEKSANYGNITYRGMEINHQWSKSGEFEHLFQAYTVKYITTSVSYFSLLRPLNELQIVKRFVNYPEYFSHFSSCNRNFNIHANDQTKKWCGTCPKCAFVFSLLAAYIPKDTVITIFGKDLFSDTSILPTYRQLLGISEFKPFECVGTPDEVRAAFTLIFNRHEFDRTPVMEMFTHEIAPTDMDASKVENETGDISAIPEPFRKLLDK